MDQELCLILGKADAKSAFLSEWNTKYVPAIVSYGEKSRKTAITDLITSMNSSGECFHFVNLALLSYTMFVTDETSRQLTALKVLSKCFGYRQLKDNLPFVYEEHNVSVLQVLL